MCRASAQRILNNTTITCRIGCCLGEDYGYEGNHGKLSLRSFINSRFNGMYFKTKLICRLILCIAGPSHWGDSYNTCIGKHQSPINIEEHNVKNISLPSLKLVGIDNPCSSFVTNNGHTVMLKTNESKAATLYGGPLGNNIYVFEQLHFHWGENDREGSEDLINNHSFPMEMHAVFYKEDYKSMDEALKHHDGLTVLAYLYEVNPKPNPVYESIIEVLPDVEAVGKEKTLKEPLLLERLLVPDITTMQNYFTYNGSLTTPPCLEIVTWIDFKTHQQLSHEQLAAFRDLRTPEGNKLTHNFRPVQPLEDRIVFHNIPKEQNEVLKNDNDPSHEHSGQHSIKMPCSIIALGILFAVVLFAM
ncbi:hypothetical protein DMN91_006212 [Ooceraea biroi]|uniref:carbonic anhydrase n=1 Tax=Ooceraea biroi TaxID=2015173 RepID=A0A3L8DNH1_OOCBI|nr:carbonic anhydrase isoform X1 [Ooceraea biroi]RLU21836.1 hypothetical protein DMN91_006212 [Ooceraea biroi]